VRRRLDPAPRGSPANPPLDLSAVFAAVALVTKAVSACGGVDAFLGLVELLERIRKTG
jgi:hypothetical protein